MLKISLSESRKLLFIKNAVWKLVSLYDITSILGHAEVCFLASPNTLLIWKLKKSYQRAISRRIDFRWGLIFLHWRETYLLNGWYWSTSNKTLLLFNNTLFDSTQKELQNEGWTTVQVRRRPKYFAKKHAITDKCHLSGNGLYCHSEQSSVFWWKQKGCNCSLEKLTLGKILGWFLFISSNHFKITFSD